VGEHKKRDGVETRIALRVCGGVDGTRTRDPRRDRPVPKLNRDKDLRPIFGI
jgi:hypothetical protein